MPDRRRSLVSAIAISFSLSATLLFPTVAQAVSDDVAVQLLQRLDQLEGEVRDLRGENEQLRDRLGKLPQQTATPEPSVASRDAVDSDTADVTVTAGESTSRLNLSLPEVDVPATRTPAATASADTSDSDTTKAMQVNETVARQSDEAEKTPAKAPEKSDAAPSRADAAEKASQASADADKADDAKQAADKGDDSDAADETARTIADIQKAAEKQVAARVNPNSPDSYFTYGEKGKKAIAESNARAIPMPQATATVASADNDAASDKAADKKDDKPKTAPVAANDTKNNTEKQARMAYNDAYKLVRESPADAVTAFRNFLNNYPKHRLVSNAQYWLGEALYTQQDYSGASVEFMKVLKQHKDSDKAPGAALKLGFSFYELKQWELARRTLEDTKRFFPNNSVAQLAQSRLTKMDAEGR